MSVCVHAIIAAISADIKPMKALHAIVGWEYSRDMILARIEGYYKNYSNLILDDDLTYYYNNGYGYARGIDVFLKQDAGLFTGWMAYSFLQSKRKEKNYHALVPTDFDITHNLKVAWKINISMAWGMSITYRYASGIPFHTGYGNWNAGRGQAYSKLDFSLSRMVSFFSNNLTIFYLSISNVLGSNNTIRYTYSPDYSEHHVHKSTNKRMVYFGVSFVF